MIVPPKKKPEAITYRWDPDLLERIRRLAERTGRSGNETAEILIRWALDRAEAELESDSKKPDLSRKKS